MSEENILSEVMNDYGRDKFYALVSGGKDSITAAVVTDRIKKLEGVIFVDTTIGVDETREFVESVCKARGWSLIILRPKVTYDDMVMKYGFPGPSHHRMAFIYLKWQPIYYWIRHHKDRDRIALISGVRRHESKRRGRNAQKIKIDGSCKHMVWVAPIIEWTDKQVWSFIRNEGLKVSPCYAKLHISGDCLCGAYAKRGEAELIQLFYPEIAERLRDLEKRCPKEYCKWGNSSSMTGVKCQKSMEDYLCADCR